MWVVGRAAGIIILLYCQFAKFECPQRDSYRTGCVNHKVERTQIFLRIFWTMLR
jgi:hypothetical protein